MLKVLKIPGRPVGPRDQGGPGELEVLKVPGQPGMQGGASRGTGGMSSTAKWLIL